MSIFRYLEKSQAVSSMDWLCLTVILRTEVTGTRDWISGRIASSVNPSTTKTMSLAGKVLSTSLNSETSFLSAPTPPSSEPAMVATWHAPPSFSIVSVSLSKILTASKMAFASGSSGSRNARLTAAFMLFFLPRTGVSILPLTPRSSSLSTQRTRVRSALVVASIIVSLCC